MSSLFSDDPFCANSSPENVFQEWLSMRRRNSPQKVESRRPLNKGHFPTTTTSLVASYPDRNDDGCCVMMQFPLCGFGLWEMFSRVPQIGKYTKSIRGQRSTALLSVWDHSSLCDARERYATDGLVNICTDVYHFFWGRFVVVTPFYWCKNAKLSAWFFTNKL